MFYEKVRDNYPTKSEMTGLGVELHLSAGQAVTHAQPVDSRMRFARDDESRLIQLTRDLLVVNQLLPYPHYEEWREEVHAAIRVYRDLAFPAGVQQLGVRYINRINIPKTDVLPVILRMEDYFRVYPSIPQELGDVHGPFMLQLYMSPVCLGHRLTLTLGLGAPEKPGIMTFLMDLYDAVELNGQPAFDRLRRLLDEAHANIVYTFENAITEKTRTLFEEIPP